MIQGPESTHTLSPAKCYLPGSNQAAGRGALRRGCQYLLLLLIDLLMAGKANAVKGAKIIEDANFLVSWTL